MRLTPERLEEIRKPWVGQPGAEKFAIPQLLAEIDALRSEKETWGNEFNAVIILKDRLSESTKRMVDVEVENTRLHEALNVAKAGLLLCKGYSACEEEVEEEVDYTLNKINEMLALKEKQ